MRLQTAVWLVFSVVGASVALTGCSKNNPDETASGHGGTGGSAMGPTGGGGSAGTGGAGAADTGPDGSVDTTGWLHGIHAFDLTVTVDNSASPTIPGNPSPSGNVFTPGPPIPVPTNQSFTLVLDADNGIAIIGTKFVSARTTDGQTFSLGEAVDVFGSTGFATVTYRDLRINVGGDVVSGSAAASVTGYGGFEKPSYKAELGLALLSGHPDTTPPSFPWTFPTTVDPDYPFSLAASEPLPLPSVVALTDPAGNRFVFAPEPVWSSASATGPAAALFFVRPKNLVLDYGTTYTLVTEGLRDFAGYPVTPLQVTTSPLPPLVAQDGFESLTAFPLAAGMIIGDGSLPPISGSKSLYVPPQTGPCIFGMRSALAVRLAMPAGGTVVRFSARVVTSTAQARRIDGNASVGKAIGGGWLLSSADPTTEIDLPGGGRGYIGAIVSVSARLPSGGTGDVVFTVGNTCSLGDTAGLIIDDLRVE